MQGRPQEFCEGYARWAFTRVRSLANEGLASEANYKPLYAIPARLAPTEKGYALAYRAYTVWAPLCIGIAVDYCHGAVKYTCTGAWVYGISCRKELTKLLVKGKLR